MKAEMIKELQENEKPICLMNKELREFMFSIKFSDFNCLQSTSTPNKPKWARMTEDHWEKSIEGDCVLRLRSDYQPEPEVIKCEVYLSTHPSHLNQLVYSKDGEAENYLYEAISDPNFIGYEYVGGSVEGKPAQHPKYVLFANNKH